MSDISTAGSGAPWWIDIIILIILTAINGFFSAAEFSIVSTSHNKVRKMAEEGDKSAARLVKLLSNPSGFLAAIQVGITFAGFLSSAIASDRFVNELVHLINPGGGIDGIKTVAIVIITLLLSYFTLVFGELVPKRLALKNPDRFSLMIAGVIQGVNIILWPFTRLLTVSTNLVLKIFGVNSDELERAITEEEIRLMVDDSNEMGNIEKTEKEMINNIFEFNDTEVSEIMTHRIDVEALSADSTLAEVLDFFSKEKYSRVPVYDENIDNIIGILHLKDLFIFLAKEKLEGDRHFDLRKHLRRPFVTPETKSIDALFHEMQKKRVQFAVVIDEYGGTAGIVTLEDLLEEIVGNIQDEYDDEDADIVKVAENSYVISGTADLEDVCKAIPCFPMPADEDNFETMAGFVINILDRIPEENERPEVTFKNLHFKVLEMQEKRIMKIRLDILPVDENAEEN